MNNNYKIIAHNANLFTKKLFKQYLLSILFINAINSSNDF